jgi:DNA repair exonuclease SbcCD ATPase subunit
MTEVELDNGLSNNIIGKNGRGKSVFVDAVHFLLTGKPFRKIKKPQLVNTVNKKGLLVEGEIEHGGKKYLIKRGIKPPIFEILRDGEPLDEDSKVLDFQKTMEQMFGYKTETLKNTMFMSSTLYQPFLKMAAGEKRGFIEDILNISIFSEIVKYLKARFSVLKEEIRDLEIEMSKLKSEIELIAEMNSKASENNEDMISKLKTKISDLEMEIEESKCEREKVEKKIEKTTAELIEQQARKKEFDDRYSKMNDEHFDQKEKYDNGKNKGITSRFTAASRVDDAHSTIKFYETEDKCIRCKQDIDPKFKKKMIKESQAELPEFEKKLKAVDVQLAKVEAFGAKVAEFKKKIDEVERRSHSIRVTIATLNSDINGMNDKLGTSNRFMKSSQTRIDETEAEIKELKNPKSLKDDSKFTKELGKKSTEREQIVHTHKVFDLAFWILSDNGIKTYIVNKYVPVFNKFVNKYLEILAAPYRLKFDSELTETIALKGYENLSYDSLSAGERARCDLSILFAFLSIARIKNSVDSNLLVLDEVADSSLDSEGIDGLIDIIDHLKSEGYTIYIISHRPESTGRFDRTLEATKARFSNLEEI